MGETWIPYCGAAPDPASWLMRWNFDPLLIACLVALGWLAWRRRSIAGAGGVAILVALFVSPLCALSSALFSVRLAHHIILAGIAAPLLARLLPVTRGGPALWAIVHAVAFWLWHAPPVYEAALSSDLMFWAMQLSLLGTAIGFWSSLRNAAMPIAVSALLLTMVQMGLLGALLTFAGSPLYAPHWLTTIAWGLSPVEDQQLGGLLLWAPGSALYLAAALAIGWRALATPRPAMPA